MVSVGSAVRVNGFGLVSRRKRLNAAANARGDMHAIRNRQARCYQPQARLGDVLTRIANPAPAFASPVAAPRLRRRQGILRRISPLADNPCETLCSSHARRSGSEHEPVSDPRQPRYSSDLLKEPVAQPVEQLTFNQ